MRAGVGYRVAGTEPQGRIATFDELYERMWWPMLRVAFALVDDVSAAGDVVQDASPGSIGGGTGSRHPPRLRVICGSVS
jgi:hypothetical protein